MPGRLSLPAADTIVYINGQRIYKTHAITINQSSGGRSMHMATIRTAITTPIVGKELLIDVSDIEIAVKSTRNTPNGAIDFERVIFWGKTSGVRPNVGNGEQLVFEARTMPCYFGRPVEGMHELNPYTSGMQILRRDIVFNPIVQGVCRGNMLKQGVGAGSHYVFLDPSRVATNAARNYATGGSQENRQSASGGDAAQYSADEFWTLKEAVYYLCWSQNGDQKNYRNPSRDELALLESADKNDRPLQNVTVDLGKFLPESLDQLLAPFGFGWCVDYVGRGNRKLSFFRRGVGERVSLRLQPPGEKVDPAKTNVEAMGAGVGYQSLINEVSVYGDHKLYESTWELKRAWSAELDATAEINLTIGTSEYESNPTYHRVWRDWVLNEGGDYIGVRQGYDAPYFFNEFNEETQPLARRRRFVPCITLDTDRQPIGRHGYVVEFKTGDEAWRPIEQLENGSFEVLRNECGIRFSGSHPPPELIYAGANAKVRITASVYSDERLNFTATRRGNSIQPEAVPAVYDAANKFKYRRRLRLSKFTASNYSSYETSQVDDTNRVKEMANRLRDAWDQADSSLSVTIPWLDGDQYKLGQVITGIDGRNIGFRIGASAEERFPQIVGITFDPQSQKQTLHLESFRDTRFV